MVNGAPVDYPLRLSDPVTSSPPAVPGMGCRTRPICQPGAVLGINACLSPSAPSFLSPLPVQLGSSLPRRASPTGLTFLKSCGPPINSYDRANEKNGLARSPACVRFMPRNILSFQIASVLIRSPLDPTFLAGGLALTVTSMACLVFSVAGCPLVC